MMNGNECVLLTVSHHGIQHIWFGLRNKSVITSLMNIVIVTLCYFSVCKGNMFQYQFFFVFSPYPPHVKSAQGCS